MTLGTGEDRISSFYTGTDEDGRLRKTRHGQPEYFTAVHCIHRFADPGSKVFAGRSTEP